MNLDKFTGSGSTPSRRAFWDTVAQVVIASKKVEGDNVSIDEHQGQGSIINVSGEGQRGGGGGGVGACCYNDGTCDDLTESDCTDAGGNWQGPGTTCADDPNPCVGACCESDGSCVDDSTPDSCMADGGTFQDFGTTCADPDIDCPMPSCGGCGFVDPLGDGRTFLTATSSQVIEIWSPAFPDCTTHCTGTEIHTINPMTCEDTCSSDGFDVDDSGCDPPNHFAGCGAFTCVGVYPGCSYSPGSHVSGDSVIFEYFCPDDCTIGGGVTCEHGIVTTTYSDECTPV